MTPEAKSLPFIDEVAVAQLLSVPMAIDAIEAAMRDLATGNAENVPRQRVSVPGASLNMLAASWIGAGVYGQKVYSVGPGGSQFWVLLYHADGRPYAVVAAQRLGRIRTGAATGVAARALARSDSRTLGVIGTGYQMRTQVEAVCAVLPIEQVRAWSPTASRREAFCEELADELGVPVSSAGSAEAAVRGADIVVTLTTSAEPVLPAAALEPGMHVTAAGSNHATRRELGTEAVRRADVVVADDIRQARAEAGDLIMAAAEGALAWDDVLPLATVVADPSRARRRDSDITLFKSIGIGLWDIACASRVAEAAIRAGRFRELDLLSGADADAPARFHRGIHQGS